MNHPTDCPVPSCEGTTGAQLSTKKQFYKVALIGEAPGEDEVTFGTPFIGKAGFKLNRLLEFAGLERQLFDIWNVCWCRPPNNQLEGTSYEYAAVDYWKPSWFPLLDRVNVAVPMGNVALHALLGEKAILKHRGYVYPCQEKFIHVLPTVHPSFILRGQSKYAAAFIHDVQKAVDLSRTGLQADITTYVKDPILEVAYAWAKAYRQALQDNPGIRLTFDIETPQKPEDEAEADPDNPSWFIWRIGFAYIPFEALSIPWTPEFIPVIKLLLESCGEKIVWNKSFDVPRIRHNGVEISGLIHDGMVAWHILHSDLPKGLGFVATFTCPSQPAWKHLSTQLPAFYNATDADVELRSFIQIEKELKATGLWTVYQRDVLDLEPILHHMSQMGMPINPVVRQDRAQQLADRQRDVMHSMEASVPLQARRIDQIFVRTPKDTTQLLSRPGIRLESVCPGCGATRPPKAHFKRFVKKINPCADLQPVKREVEVEEWYRLSKFTPSRDQLVRYHAHHKRPLPTKWDKKEGKRKVSFEEKNLVKLEAKYPKDPLYALILEFRELDKVAGTYIGRPALTNTETPAIIPDTHD